MITKSKIAGLSFAAKLVLGIGAAAASTSGAAALGVLPDIGGGDPTVGSGAPIAGVEFADTATTVLSVVESTVPVVVETAPVSVEAPPAEAPPLEAPSVEVPSLEAPPLELPFAPEPPAEEPPVAEPPVVEEPAGAETHALECFQSEGWWGVICEWDASSHGGAEYYLVINGSPERIWGDNPTSFVDVHADTIGETYTYSLLVKLDDDVVGESGEVVIVLEQWETDEHD